MLVDREQIISWTRYDGSIRLAGFILKETEQLDSAREVRFLRRARKPT